MLSPPCRNGDAPAAASGGAFAPNGDFGTDGGAGIDDALGGNEGVGKFGSDGTLAFGKSGAGGGGALHERNAPVADPPLDGTSFAGGSDALPKPPDGGGEKPGVGDGRIDLFGATGSGVSGDGRAPRSVGIFGAPKTRVYSPGDDSGIAGDDGGGANGATGRAIGGAAATGGSAGGAACGAAGGGGDGRCVDGTTGGASLTNGAGANESGAFGAAGFAAAGV
jgi:hypothetical protein